MSTVFQRTLIRAATAPLARQQRTFASSEPLVKTALYEMHKELGGDMVPFAGYELPVLYKRENGGVMKEHLWCREKGKSSMFDVSHMGQVRGLLLDVYVSFSIWYLCFRGRVSFYFHLFAECMHVYVF